jgi:hypothetical protein
VDAPAVEDQRPADRHAGDVGVPHRPAEERNGTEAYRQPFALVFDPRWWKAGPSKARTTPTAAATRYPGALPTIQAMPKHIRADP